MTAPALVVGASSGIGRSLCEELARKGRRVIAVARRQASLEELAAPHGDRIWALPLDTSDREAVHHAMARIREREWIPDLVILGAGTAGDELPDFDLEAHRQTFETNYFGLLAWVEELLPEFQARGAGTFVAISSLMAYRALATTAVSYPASKAALSLAFAAFREYSHADGVRFVTVQPGPVDTAMLQTDGGRPPGTWSPERAARHILRQLDRGRVEINFPRIYTWVAKASLILPPRLWFWLIRRRERPQDRTHIP